MAKESLVTEVITDRKDAILTKSFSMYETLALAEKISVLSRVDWPDWLRIGLWGKIIWDNVFIPDIPSDVTIVEFGGVMKPELTQTLAELGVKITGGSAAVNQWVAVVPSKKAGSVYSALKEAKVDYINERGTTKRIFAKT